MTTIRFRNIAYSAPSFSHRARLLPTAPDQPPSSFYTTYYRFGMKVYAEMDDFPAAIERREELPWV